MIEYEIANIFEIVTSQYRHGTGVVLLLLLWNWRGTVTTVVELAWYCYYCCGTGVVLLLLLWNWRGTVVEICSNDPCH